MARLSHLKVRRWQRATAFIRFKCGDREDLTQATAVAASMAPGYGFRVKAIERRDDTWGPAHYVRAVHSHHDAYLVASVDSDECTVVIDVSSAAGALDPMRVAGEIAQAVIRMIEGRGPEEDTEYLAGAGRVEYITPEEMDELEEDGGGETVSR